jgi:hypothetical protein
MTVCRFQLPRRRSRSAASILSSVALFIFFTAARPNPALGTVPPFDAHGLASPSLSPEIIILRNAYVHLAVGNHDYYGAAFSAPKLVLQVISFMNRSPLVGNPYGLESTMPRSTSTPSIFRHRTPIDHACA